MSFDFTSYRRQWFADGVTIAHTVDDPLLVRNASRTFFETFEVGRDDTIGHLFYELGNGQWDTRGLVLVARLIEFASAFYTLMPGDVIFTGTPSRVGRSAR